MPLVEFLEARRLLATYYVSPFGNDGWSGTSAGAARKTIDRVNQQALGPGDRVLFQGGQTFHGSIYIPSQKGGTPSAPLTFGTYGSGRATILSGSRAGIDVAQTAGVSISNLVFRGNGMHNNTANGIWFHADWSDRKLRFIRINNVDVSGYGGYNIKIAAPGARSSYSDVRITNANLHDSREGGLWINASANNANKDIYIGNVKAWNHPGSGSTSKVTGNGIFVADVEDALIERSVAYNNGERGAAPVGIWAAGSNRVTIQFCESHNNKTMTSTDGGGFDFDWDVTNSIMQYNFSHDNHGPGFILAGGTRKNDGNIIRYNISQNDGRRNGRAGIQLWGRVTNARIYHNVVYMPYTGNSGSAAFMAHNMGAGGAAMHNVMVRNNIFYTRGGVKLVRIAGGFSASDTNKLIGNAYYAASNFQIDWNGTIYSNLNAFRYARSQERINGMNVGFQGHPRLQGIGKAPTLNDAYKLDTLWQYKLQRKSPLVNAGMNPLVSSSTLSSVSRDFFGNTTPRNGRYDVGVHEANWS